MTRRTSIRLGLAVVGVIVVIVAAASFANASGRTSLHDVGGGTADAGSAVADPGVAIRPISGSAIAEPAWCCTSGSAPGLTVSGQATVQGEGATARDEAIAQAVADATDQAKAAAQAANITLGKILDMQVAAPPYAYPYPVAAGTSTSVGVPAAETNAASAPSGTGTACPGRAVCAPTPIPVPIETYASVTITWAIG